MRGLSFTVRAKGEALGVIICHCVSLWYNELENNNRQTDRQKKDEALVWATFKFNFELPLTQ